MSLMFQRKRGEPSPSSTSRCGWAVAWVWSTVGKHYVRSSQWSQQFRLSASKRGCFICDSTFQCACNVLIFHFNLKYFYTCVHYILWINSVCVVQIVESLALVCLLLTTREWAENYLTLLTSNFSSKMWKQQCLPHRIDLRIKQIST